MNNYLKKKLTKNWFKLLQDVICFDIEEIEGKKKIFKSKTWKRNLKKDEGGGEFRIFENGKIFEKVGVNYSEVYGKLPSKFKNEVPGAQKDPSFWASGISIVMHPKNPHIPSMHFNTRYLTTTKSWFGGGMDLTPCLDFDTESQIFHRELEDICNRYNDDYYPKYKKWCDEYFYLKHRKEPRGIGGIFFDHLNSGNQENDFEFVKDVGKFFLKHATYLINKDKDRAWTSREKDVQLIKRGRYVEFNLLYDRGTKFGLETGGNTEAILMSMPPIANWE